MACEVPHLGSLRGLVYSLCMDVQMVAGVGQQYWHVTHLLRCPSTSAMLILWKKCCYLQLKTHMGLEICKLNLFVTVLSIIGMSWYIKFVFKFRTSVPDFHCWTEWDFRGFSPGKWKHLQYREKQFIVQTGSEAPFTYSIYCTCTVMYCSFENRDEPIAKKRR